jgi:peptide/nickel transport system permease protein
MRVNFCKNSLPLEAPSFSHWFGTNVRGYDVFSRTLFGSQAALQVVLLATSLSVFIGVPLGLISGYWGGGKLINSYFS